MKDLKVNDNLSKQLIKEEDKHVLREHQAKIDKIKRTYYELGQEHIEEYYKKLIVMIEDLRGDVDETDLLLEGLSKTFITGCKYNMLENGLNRIIDYIEEELK